MTNDKQRERLVELLMSKSCHYNKCPDVPCNKCEYVAIFEEDAELIADYLLSKGIIVPPVMIGQTVYTLGHRNAKRPVEWKVVGTWFSEDESCNYMYLYWYKDKDNFVSRQVDFSEIGKKVFLSREEAEKALGGVQG